MKAKVNQVKLNGSKRTLVISDIHGNLKGFKQLLGKVGYSGEDILIINGDMVEKGTESLNTLHYIMDLCRQNEVYVLCGNCDSVAVEIFHKEEHKNLLDYLLWRKNSLLNEMLQTLDVKLTADTDMENIKDILIRNFKTELNWIQNLPDIIETEKLIFAHAAITSGDLYNQPAGKVQRTDAFMEQGLYFNKYCIVGHWPVVLYSKGKPSFNPIIDREHKVISIDGGNVIKRDGQLNALIIPKGSTDEFTYDYYDDLPAAIVLENQTESTGSIYIPWTDNKIKVLKIEEEFTYCEHESTNTKLWVLNKFIFEDKAGFHCDDFTDYKLPVLEGETVSLIEETKKGYLIKKNGITGWYYGKLEMI